MINYKYNERIAPDLWRVRFTGSARSIKSGKHGDPFKGEVLCIPWETVRDGEISLSVTLQERIFLNRVIIRTSEKTSLLYARAYADSTLLSEHCAETGKTITCHTLELSLGAEAEELTLTFCCDFSELSLLSIDVYASESENVDLFPSPRSICFGEGYISASLLDSYTAEGCAATAGCMLADKLRDMAGVCARETRSGAIRFAFDASIPHNGYKLEVTSKGALITASDERGYVIGAETLIKLIKKDRRIPAVTVEDSPFARFRGVHLMVPSKGQLPFAKRLIRHVISPLGYNVVILELAGLGMRYDSHPKIASSVEDAIERSHRGEMPSFPHGECIGQGRVVEKETLKEFIDYIRSFGIEVIPEVQSLSHVQFMTYTYPEIAELDPNKDEAVDIRLADALPSQVYPHCYCPSNPRSYEILFDIMDEVIDLFAPLKYVHIGHDEVYRIGVCQKCRGKDPAELFASDVKRIYDYLSERGIKTMMWSDMLQPVTKYKTYDAAKVLPRDIIMLDFIWYFHLDKDIEENLLSYGYKTAFGNLYSSHFPRFESRIRREGIIGGQISTWKRTEENSLQEEGKFYDLFMVAQMLWDYRYDHIHRPAYDRMISALMPRTRELIKDISYPSLAENAIRESLNRDGSARFSCASENKYKSLVFSHTLKNRYSRMPWKAQEKVGEYLLTYDDESTESVIIKSGREIGYCGARPGEPLKNPLYRHSGYTASYECDSELVLMPGGSCFTVYKYEHLLPKGKRVTSVEWIQKENAEALEVLTIEGINSGI